MAESDEVFGDLRSLLQSVSEGLVVRRDDPEEYSLDTRHLLPSGNPLFFAAVQRRKSGVSLHLMPLYLEPSLLDGIPECLRRRVSGKSCLRFRSLDEPTRQGIRELVGSGLELYRSKGYV
ncbi:MAG: hypothetical protein ACK41F_10360 [Fimbriimonadaceae bacterium]